MAFFPGSAAKVPSLVGLGAPNTRLLAGAVAETPAALAVLVVEVVEEVMGAEAACSAGMEMEELVVVEVEVEEEGSEVAVAAATAAAEAAAAAAAAAVAAAFLFATEEAVGIE